MVEIYKYIIENSKFDNKFSDEQLNDIDDYCSDSDHYNDFKSDLAELVGCFKIVYSELEDYGRWTNMSTKVYQVVDKYFKVKEVVIKSESQDGMDDLEWEIEEVYAKTIETVIYE